jgi:hypothetical protein
VKGPGSFSFACNPAASVARSSIVNCPEERRTSTISAAWAGKPVATRARIAISVCFIVPNHRLEYTIVDRSRRAKKVALFPCCMGRLWCPLVRDREWRGSVKRWTAVHTADELLRAVGSAMKQQSRLYPGKRLAKELAEVLVSVAPGRSSSTTHSITRRSTAFKTAAVETPEACGAPDWTSCAVRWRRNVIKAPVQSKLIRMEPPTS